MRGESYIFYNGQFWVGLFSEEEGGRVARVGLYIFGLEPKASDLDAWLAAGSPGLVMKDVDSDADALPPAAITKLSRINPKRRLREAQREQKNSVSEGKAQKAMREVIERNKLESKTLWRCKRDEQEAYKFACRMEKKKNKHRGH